MYHAKTTGAQVPVVYDPALESGAFRNKQIEEALRSGLENNEFSVVYQPILRSSDGQIDSVEALVRWSPEKLGPISPATFIPIAEETGLIADIGVLVMRKACSDLAALPGVKLNLNISPVQLRDPMFAENMKAIANEFDIRPMRIEFELTEGIIVNHPELACKTLSLLKDAGFGLALDDFGTGFSSIGYLRRFPFDRMKIDRSFIADIGKSSKANSLLQSLVTLGDALDLQVVAEGIETQEQGDLITLLGCEYLQGYFYSRPMPIEQFPAFASRNKPLRLYSIK
jgi:EAL domain-containing protein (putative c-di-GMP-specific phosphodiesterase class I)